MSGLGSGCKVPTVLSQHELDLTDAALRMERNEYQAKNRAERRIIVFAHYGNKCACCGETETGFLTIDHIGGRIPEMEECGMKLGGDNLYKYLVSHNYPPGYRCLCANCNMAIGWWGVCPHEKAKLSISASSTTETLDIPLITKHHPPEGDHERAI